MHNMEEEEDNDEDLTEEEELEDIDGDDELRTLSRRRRKPAGTNRGVTLSNLLSDGILEAADGIMSIDYLGKKFIADLLPDGRIRWQETMQIFNSPSAWAIHCKKLINPDKKSGCGWASVKYKGKKLDIYKSAWFRKTKAKEAEAKKEVPEESEEVKMEEETDPDEVKTPAARDKKRKIVKHSSLGHRSLDHDLNTLVECTTFSALGKIQPFTVTITTTCLLLVDYHCHLTSGEVVGYLAGSWDVDSHNLAIQRAFPCRCRLADKDGAARVEEEIREQLEKANLSLVGWYHSHPHASSNPTIRDITSQMSYQMQLKGESASSYTPCIGLICAPYFKEGSSSESSMQTYWVMPPPENRPQDFGKPMLMNYGIVHDIILSQDMLTEMRVLHDYYKPAPDIIDFSDKWKDDITYMDKLLSSLSRKCPGEQSDVQLAEFVQNLILPS